MMQLEQEHAFLNKVAHCLGRDTPLRAKPEREEVGPPVFWREKQHSPEEALDMFKNNLESLTGRVVIAKNKSEVQEQLKEWIKELGAKSILCWNHPQLRELTQPGDLGIEVFYWDKGQDPKTLRELAAKVDIGLTWVDYAIGYTGTMATLSDPDHGRLVNLLPPTHIAVFTTAQLVPTMSQVIGDLGKQRGKEGLPAAITFVTGPSRTSDIEMDLSIGVHGPYRTWVIILDEK